MGRGQKVSRNKKVFLMGVLLVCFFVVTCCVYSLTQSIPSKEGTPERFKNTFDVPFLGEAEITNPSIAAAYGIKGYILATAAPNTPKLLDTTKTGGIVDVTILLSFVSYSPKLIQTKVNIDPLNSSGTKLEIVTYSGGVVNINELTDYEPHGVLTIRNNEIVAVKVRIAIPTSVLGGMNDFYLSCVGMTADVPILQEMDVMIHV
jgi:hypothetical protein